jgi:GWxTD domain-containing protein
VKPLGGKRRSEAMRVDARRSALKRAAWIAGIVLALAAAAVPERPAAETVGWGDFEIFLDNAAFRSPSGGSTEEIYIRVRNSGVRFKEVRGKLEAKLRLRITVVDSTAKTVASEDRDVFFTTTEPEEASSPLRFNTIIEKLDLAPGKYLLTCVVEDLYAPKLSVVGFLKDRLKSVRIADYPLTVPRFAADAVSVSDARFLWEVDRASPGTAYVPNPPRLYGLYRDSLRVYVETYTQASLAGTEGLRFGMEVLDEKGEKVRKAALPLPARGSTADGTLVTYPLLIQEDLNTLPAGSYTLFLSAGAAEGLLVRMRAGRFSIAWDLRTWEIAHRDYLAEARFLLADRDFSAFAALPLGEQEKTLAETWKSLDPDPATGVNEAYEKFVERREYVNAMYSDYQTGIFSDRGLIYLKYGPPDELEVDVVPQNRESLSDALEKVDDKFHPIDYSNTGSRLRYARPGDNIFVDPKRLGMVGEQGDVGYPYELWTYNAGGDPILERDRALEQDIGLRFIFIDTEGYGRYKLESSSSMMSK